MAKIMCDNCGKRPAKMFRMANQTVYKKRHLVVKSSPDHPLCRQCHNSNFESMRQRDMERTRRQVGVKSRE